MPKKFNPFRFTLPKTFKGQCENLNPSGIRCQRKAGHESNPKVSEHIAHHVASDLTFMWAFDFTKQPIPFAKKGK